MDNYTMTFYCRDCLVVPPDPRMRHRQVQRQVLERMLEHKLELVDFNRTDYLHTYPGYDKRGDRYKTLVEIRLDLSRFDLRSREAIFNRCLNALQHDELHLAQNGDAETDADNIFVFDMKNQAAAS